MKKTIDKCKKASIIRIVRFRKTEPRKDENKNDTSGKKNGST